MTLNFISKKYITVFSVFAFLVNIANAQVVKVNKKVLVFKKFGGDHDVYDPVPYDSTKTRSSPQLQGFEGDSFMIGIMPFFAEFPLEVYLEDLHANRPRYMYNDVFIYKKGNYDYSSIEGTNITKEVLSKQPELNIMELDKSDVPYVYSKNLGAVAKFWVLDAEWEMHTVKKIPREIQGWAPMNLIFENYHIYMLTKINGISVVPKSPYRSSYAPLIFGQLRSRIKSK
ncbi:MAG: hypothetical protein EOO42_12685 [Flavobacteriales bacterium]|nr:MAG: hypothetical protein EOO42_12685 [Flavobacteriales bacterium]